MDDHYDETPSDELVPSLEQARPSRIRRVYNAAAANRFTRPFILAGKKTWEWTAGPDPPEIQRINPVFPAVQAAPLRLLAIIAPKRKYKFAILILFYLVWIITFSALIHVSDYSSQIKGYGVPTQLGCLSTFWLAGNQCGLDGDDCRPFTNYTLPFRCPADCGTVQVLNPRAVGDQEINYSTFVIGGPADDGNGPALNSTYRGDSFICTAAVHAGITTNSEGGCGVVKLLGTRSTFKATDRNGIKSIGFNSSFPQSFTFDVDASGKCEDLRWSILAASLVFTITISLFTSSPGIFFGTVFVGIFFHVGLVSDPPFSSDYYSVLSVVLSRFLPACFIAFVLYQYYIRKTLTGLFAQVEKTILWLGGCWVGALNNYTFEHIPIQRLTPHDLNAQPGAKAALTIIVLILVGIVVCQAWFFRLEGRMRRYLALYISFGIVLGLLAAIPGLSLRIHHYILGMLLLPGTSMQTRPSLLFQGILVGLFINGVTRWGFASILQTPAELIGSGQTGSALPALLSAPIIAAKNITFNWSSPPQPDFDGASVLVNDVERYRGYDSDATTFTFTAGSELPRNYSDVYALSGYGPLPDKYYFRFGYLSGSSSGDYTRAGIWDVLSGIWTDMPSGPSKR